MVAWISLESTFSGYFRPHSRKTSWTLSGQFSSGACRAKRRRWVVSTSLVMTSIFFWVRGGYWLLGIRPEVYFSAPDFAEVISAAPLAVASVSEPLVRK